MGISPSHSLFVFLCGLALAARLPINPASQRSNTDVFPIASGRRVR